MANAPVLSITGAVASALAEWDTDEDSTVRDFLSVLADHGYVVAPINYTEGDTDGTTPQGNY